MTTTTDLCSIANMTAATTPAQLQIVSVPPLKVADNEHVVCWSRRSTEKNPVAESERYRGTIVPKASLAIPHDACHSPFYALLQSTVHSLADATFTAFVRENMHAVQMDAGRLSLDAVLAFWAEKKASETIDAEKIVAWLKASATYAALPEATARVWLNKLPKIAAPSYGNLFTKEQAAAIVSKIKDSDLEHPAALFVIQRANNVLNREAAVDVL